MALNNQSIVARLLADYRDENIYLITKFKNVLSYLKKTENLDDLEKKDVVGGWLSINSDLEPAFDAIHLNIDRLIETVNNFLECLEEEKKQLDKYMKGLKKATAESQDNIERLLINYNEKQHYFMQELNSMIPGLIELADKAIGMEDLTIGEIAGKIKSTYETLEQALLNKKTDKDSLYLIFEEILFKLRDNAKGLGDIIGKLGDSNSAKFIANFRRERSILSKLEKHRRNSGRDKDKDKLYSDLDDNEKIEKLDKFMKEKLIALFDGIEIGDENKSPKKYIAEIIKIESDFIELKKLYEESFKALASKLRKTHALVRGKSLEDFYIVGVQGLAKSVTFKKFESDFLNNDNKKIVDAVIDYLDDLVGSDKGKNPYKNFINENLKLIKDKSVGEGDDSEDSIKDRSKNIINAVNFIESKIAHREAEEFFDDDAHYNSIKARLNLILQNLVGQSSSDFPSSDDAKSAIKKLVKKYKADKSAEDKVLVNDLYSLIDKVKNNKGDSDKEAWLNLLRFIETNLNL